MDERSILGTSHSLGDDLAIPVACPPISDYRDAALQSAGVPEMCLCGMGVIWS